MSNEPAAGLAEELLVVAQSLNQSNIRWALVGGFAVSLLTEPRATQDIDMLVASGDWDAITSALRPLGYRELSGPMDFKAISLRRLTKIEGDEVYVLSFVFADEETRAGLERPLPYTYRGRQLAIAPPHTIITLKQRRNSPIDAAGIEKLKKLLEENPE